MPKKNSTISKHPSLSLSEKLNRGALDRKKTTLVSNSSQLFSSPQQIQHAPHTNMLSKDNSLEDNNLMEPTKLTK